MVGLKSVVILLAFISFMSCTGQQADKRILPYTTFYWEKNTENEFHALRCDTLNCSLISFGPNEANSRRILRLQYDGETILLTDSASKEKIGQLIISNDTLVSLQIARHQDKTYKMIPDPRRFAELFSFLKGKYSFECVPSNKVSYNGIIAMETSVDSYLENKNYRQVSETLTDEIYGSVTSNYLEFHGNRFYYTPKKSRFDKMEIVSNDIEGFFLNIRIGDTRAQVLKKLGDKTVMNRSSKNEITVDVCNSRFSGQFGFIKFRFRKLQKGSSEQVLEKIVYQPLLESE